LEFLRLGLRPVEVIRDALLLLPSEGVLVLYIYI